MSGVYSRSGMAYLFDVFPAYPNSSRTVIDGLAPCRFTTPDQAGPARGTALS